MLATTMLGNDDLGLLRVLLCRVGGLTFEGPVWFFYRFSLINRAMYGFRAQFSL